MRLLTDDDHCMRRLDPAVRGLERAGAELRYVPTSCALFQLAHNKFGVFDERLAINGSGNWSRAGLERNFENFVVLSAPADVRAFADAFVRSWALGSPRSACGCDPSEPACRERFCLDRPPR